jgi:hypothetical protein
MVGYAVESVLEDGMNGLFRYAYVYPLELNGVVAQETADGDIETVEDPEGCLLYKFVAVEDSPRAQR